MNHLGTKKIETARLILRPFVREDADAMYRNWASDRGDEIPQLAHLSKCGYGS